VRRCFERVGDGFQFGGGERVPPERSTRHSPSRAVGHLLGRLTPAKSQTRSAPPCPGDVRREVAGELAAGIAAELARRAHAQPVGG
jgi:hypothetical protein